MNDEVTDTVEHIESRYYGKYRGKVVSNSDPESRGRLRVSCPAVGEEDDGDELWALPCVPYAGNDRGMLFLPDVGTQIWVEFEAGDPSMPIWSGCYWDKSTAPGGGEPHIKIIKTEKIEIRIDDEENKITIGNAFGTMLEIKDGRLVIKANTEIALQVATMKAALNVTKFDIHDGAMSIS